MNEMINLNTRNHERWNNRYDARARGFQKLD